MGFKLQKEWIVTRRVEFPIMQDGKRPYVEVDFIIPPLDVLEKQQKDLLASLDTAKTEFDVARLEAKFLLGGIKTIRGLQDENGKNVDFTKARGINVLNFGFIRKAMMGEYAKTSDGVSEKNSGALPATATRAARRAARSSKQRKK